MGIPRFYRWLSERYPLINENIAAEQIPDFDNLYLDMNGIIHNCSHNNTGGLCVKEESDVFVEAFKYITRLFNIIRPKKLLYMAVDGCAPRAKMNQQRSRRFRAANEAREAREQAESHGEVITGTQFDSNCITPGTEFMSKLTEHLRFFVCMKIQEDPLWQDVTVVLSGPDEPGEGEHKIMDYIRTSKAQPGYAANLRHCLYGLDADLIMLALASHEPHFALLREEVVFGKRVTEDVEKRTVTSKDRFQLLHVSLLREYLELEFKPPQGTPLPFVFNLERLIDDVILFCVLVGNDFLPSLPFAEIGEGGLDDFFTVYKEHLDKAERSHPPWLTYDCGKVDFEQVARFLWRYSLIEERKMEGAVEDGNWLLGKRRTMGPAEAPDPPEGRIEGPIECVASADEARLQYYQVKFGMDVNSHAGTQQRRKLFQAYLEGMQWVMLYYYRGPNASSWSWYYPFYHAPMAVDMADYDRITCPDVSFDVGEPFRPFQQLMAVLPSNSKILLPECFRWLFDSPSSPILDFYPQKFEIDMDGVKVPWGGVTLIPWIEEKRLVSAMAEAESRGEPLSEKEDRQNSFGPAYGFRYDRGAVSSVSSPMPHRFKSLLKCPVRMSVFKHPPLPMGMAHFINNVLPGFKRNASGFPTLHMHPLSCTFETGVKVFQFESRGKSLIVRLRPETGLVPAPSELQRLLRAPCARVDYPFAHRGRVVAVHTADVKYLQGGQTVQNNPREHEALVRQLTQDQRRKGLALDFGPAAYLNSGAGDAAAGAGQGRRGGHSSADETWLLPLAEVKLAEASYIDAEGRRQHSFQASGSELRLLHLVREEGEDEEAERQARRASGPRTLAERFPTGCAVLCVDARHEAFGKVGTVVECNIAGGEVEAHFELAAEAHADPELALQREVRRIVEQQHATLKWHDITEVARQTELDVHVVRQIFGSLMSRTVDNVREDLGMNLTCEAKSSGAALCLPCWSMKQREAWFFSDLAVRALKDYKQNFEGLFVALRQRRPKPGQWERDFEMRFAFPDSPDVEYAAKKLVKYVNGCAFKKLRLAPGSYMALEPGAISEVARAVDRSAEEADLICRSGGSSVSVVRGHGRLFRAEDAGSRPSADLLARPGEVSVGERGVYVKAFGVVPVGSRATVIGVYGTGASQEFEILLDEDNFSASDCQGRTPAMRGLLVAQSAFMPLNATAAATAKSSRAQPQPQQPPADDDVTHAEASRVLLGLLRSSTPGREERASPDAAPSALPYAAPASTPAAPWLGGGESNCGTTASQAEGVFSSGSASAAAPSRSSNSISMTAKLKGKVAAKLSKTLAGGLVPDAVASSTVGLPAEPPQAPDLPVPAFGGFSAGGSVASGGLAGGRREAASAAQGDSGSAVTAAPQQPQQPQQLQQPQQQLCVQEVAVATLPKGEVQSSQAVVQQVVAGVAPTANALQTETRPILRACAAFTASSSSQLTLSVADLVEIVERHASGWTYGRKVSDVRGEGAAEGWFPDWVVPNQHAAQK